MRVNSTFTIGLKTSRAPCNWRSITWLSIFFQGHASHTFRQPVELNDVCTHGQLVFSRWNASHFSAQGSPKANRIDVSWRNRLWRKESRTEEGRFNKQSHKAAREGGESEKTDSIFGKGNRNSDLGWREVKETSGGFLPKETNVSRLAGKDTLWEEGSACRSLPVA